MILQWLSCLEQYFSLRTCIPCLLSKQEIRQIHIIITTLVEFFLAERNRVALKGLLI